MASSSSKDESPANCDSVMGVQIHSISDVEVLCTKKEDFENWLMSRVSRQSTMVSRTHGEKIIQFLRDQRDSRIHSQELKSKYSPSFRFQVKRRKFKLINVVGLGDILCLPIKDKSLESHSMLGEHRQVIFKEDMFGVIDSAHRNGDKHRGYKGTFKKISASYCNIPREVVHKYVSMCGFCQQAHACYIPTTTRSSKTQKVSLEKKKVIESGFFTRCQIDIIDLQNFPDAENGFSFIGHFFDHHTKYNVLFPLHQSDANTVAATLCQYVFGHFGLPTILHSSNGRKFVDELILWVMQFWSTDAKIFNGNPKRKNLNLFMEQRRKTILLLIETMKSKQPEFSNWSSLLPGIQYSLNTNSFEANSVPAFDLVFHRRPKVFLGTNEIVSEKDILKEENVFLEEEVPPKAVNKDNYLSQENRSIDQVASLSDLIPSENNSPLIISGVTNDFSNVQDASQQKHPEQPIPDSILCDLSSLRAVPCGAINQHLSFVTTNLGANGQTIQIPVVSIDGAGELSGSVVISTRPYESVVGETRETFDNSKTFETNQTLQLTNISEINLTSEETLNIETGESVNQLANENTHHIELSNKNSVHLELSNEEVGCAMNYDSLSIVNDDNVMNDTHLT